MKTLLTNLSRKAVAAISIAAILSVSAPIQVFAIPVIDVQVNSSTASSVDVEDGNSYTISWSATADTCDMTSPVSSGSTLSGSSVVNPGDAIFYPTVGSSVTITISCDDVDGTTSDSVTVNIIPATTLPAPTVSLTANGSTGSVSVTNGSDITLAWTSTDATTCDFTSPTGIFSSGVGTSNTGIVLSSTDAGYPASSTSETFTISCDNASGSTSSSVIVNMSGGTTGGGGASVDIMANGSQGPVNVTSGTSLNFTWTSANLSGGATCDITAPSIFQSGVGLNGSTTLLSTDAGYPAVGSSITMSISCVDGTTTVSDSVTVNIISGGSTGGGGSSSGGGSRSTSLPVQCPWINSYMREGLNNNPVEVMKLQSFLKVFMGYDYVVINGVFDDATRTAVGAFQTLYSDDILAPWGHTAPTYYVYILTLKKVNEIYCQNISPLTADQLAEITAFRIALETAQAAQVPVSFTDDGQVPSENSTSTPIELPIVGSADSQGQDLRALAAAIFTLPDNLKDILWPIYEVIVILLVLYVLGTLLANVLYKDLPEEDVKKFIVKWGFLSLGLAGIISAALVWKMFDVILPLIVALILSMFWALLVIKGEVIHRAIKSWYSNTSEKIKSLFRKSTS